MLHKTSLLIEWNMGHVRGNGIPDIVVQCYAHIKDSFNGTEPLHQLVVICAIICAGLLPCIYTPPMGPTPKEKSDFEDKIHSLDWASRTKKGAAKDPQPFITMVIGFILALFDDTNPIWEKHSKFAAQDFESWLGKHCEPSPFALSLPFH